MAQDGDDDLEPLYKILTDEDALRLATEQQYRYKRARLNPGAPVLEAGALGDVALEVVASVAVKILEGTIEIRTAGQARDVAAVFHQIGRLEMGKSTSNPGDLPREERERMVAELANAAAERAAQHAEQEKGLRAVPDLANDA